jgi:hypothetical protein
VSGTTLTVNTTGGAPAAGTVVGVVRDLGSGSDLFLTPSNTNILVAGGPIDSWLDTTSWALGAPSTSPAAGTNFNIDNNGNSANANIPNYIYMPATLQQATGIGTSTWTIDDSSGGTAPFLSAFSVVNQGSSISSTPMAIPMAK